MRAQVRSAQAFWRRALVSLLPFKENDGEIDAMVAELISGLEGKVELAACSDYELRFMHAVHERHSRDFPTNWKTVR